MPTFLQDRNWGAGIKTFKHTCILKFNVQWYKWLRSVYTYTRNSHLKFEKAATNILLIRMFYRGTISKTLAAEKVTRMRKIVAILFPHQFPSTPNIKANWQKFLNSNNQKLENNCIGILKTMLRYFWSSNITTLSVLAYERKRYSQSMSTRTSTSAAHCITGRSWIYLI